MYRCIKYCHVSMTNIPIIICTIWIGIEGWIVIPDSSAVDVNCSNNAGKKQLYGET
jgi:hypothetical protein